MRQFFPTHVSQFDFVGWSDPCRRFILPAEEILEDQEVKKRTLCVALWCFYAVQFLLNLSEVIVSTQGKHLLTTKPNVPECGLILIYNTRAWSSPEMQLNLDRFRGEV